MSILVTYATSKGSTREIAERIASRLGAYTTSECLPIEKVRAESLPHYSAIVVGSAIHMGSWLAPARHFIHDNAATLSGQPVWAFSVGMPPQEKERAKEEAMLEGKIRKQLPKLRAHVLFQGRFYKAHLPWLARMIFTCCVPKEKAKWGDERDWANIEAWAEKVGAECSGRRPADNAQG